MKNYRTFLVLILLFLNHSVKAQETAGTLTTSEKKETIHSVIDIIDGNYVFPEVAKKVTDLLQQKLENGDYKTVEDPAEFATVLTKDIQSFNQDRHLRVLYEPDRISEQNKAVSEEERLRYQQERLRTLRRDNFGFKEIKIFDGNIGYLKLTDFADPKYAGDTVKSAMNFLSNADAVIIDVRNNGGGTPKMVQLLSSYFLESEPVHLNSFYKRQENITKQFWSLPYVPGSRMPEVPLYIVTNRNTFSAAEEFCYDLKHLGRATIIGENTVGGAHPGGRINATEKYNVWTPTGRAINPKTNTNWEGVGVQPHIEVSGDVALTTALDIASDSL